MTGTSHALVGLSLAALIPDPVIGIPIAIISHVACDAFPHWDTGTNMKSNKPTSQKTRRRFVIESFIDLGVSFVLPLILLLTIFESLNPLYAYIMVISAQGLDWLSSPRVFLKWNLPPFTWAYSLQGKFDHRLDQPWGIVGQIAVVLFFISLAVMA
jgi:hypothetical protein